MNLLNYLDYFSPLIILAIIALYLAVFGKVDRSDEQKSFTHRVSKKH